MITNNVYHRVFCLKVGDQSGTCFSLDIEEKQYVVTAKHLIKLIRENPIGFCLPDSKLVLKN